MVDERDIVDAAVVPVRRNVANANASPMPGPAMEMFGDRDRMAVRIFADGPV